MKIRQVVDSSDANWKTLRFEFVGHQDEEQHRSFAATVFGTKRKFSVWLAEDLGQPAGLLEGAVRLDYVNGCGFGPVGFIELLYVRQESRGQGIARTLVEQFGEWARLNACAQIATDAFLEDRPSHDAYRAMGFVETERVVYFRRPN